MVNFFIFIVKIDEDAVRTYPLVSYATLLQASSPKGWPCRYQNGIDSDSESFYKGGPRKNFNYRLTCMDLKDLRSAIIIGATACLELNEDTGSRTLLPGEGCCSSILISRGEP